MPPGASEHCRAKGAPEFALTMVTIPAELDADNKLFNGRPEYGSGVALLLIRFAMAAAIVVGVSPGSTV